MEIQKDVPRPFVSRDWVKTLDEMEVNDSIPVKEGSQQSVRQISARYFHKRGEKRFTTKRDPIDKENYRTWRLS